MSSESMPPPPPSDGGGLRYALVGLVLALLAGVGWWMTSTPSAPPTAALPDAGPRIERSTALVDDLLEIAVTEPDAGMPDAGPPPEAEEAVRRTPRASTGEWDCSGELPREAVASVVRSFDAQIRSCYERRLKANPLLSGTMSLEVKVGASGGVEGVQVGGSLRDRDVFSCVRGVATRMRFPAVSGGSCAVLRVPFEFSPEN